jgi:ubiquinone/menaquinone biosynthesis C-methylase UbiE
VPREPYHQALDRVERDHWWFRALRRLVVESLREARPPPARVLDVGCSTGHLLGALSNGYERTGVDVDEHALALASRLRPGIRFVTGGIERLPFEDAAFDAVLATDVVSAVGVDDDRQAIQELRRVLVPGGVLIIQVAAYEWLRSGHDRVAGTARRYTARNLKRLLDDAGFATRRLTYRVTLVFPAAAVRRLMFREREQSDVVPVSPWLNRTLGGLMAAEHPLARRLRLPFGLSVFAVAGAGDGRG